MAEQKKTIQKVSAKITPIAKVEAPKAEVKKQPAVKAAQKVEAKTTTVKSTLTNNIKAEPAAKTPVAKVKAVTTKPATTAKPVSASKAKAPAAKTVTPADIKEEVNVRFDVSLYGEALNATNIYIVGNIAALGSWDARKGLALISKGSGQFEASIKFPKNTDVEYKVCNRIDWNGVEKGLWGEELENHSFKACKDSIQIIGVSKWRN